MGSRYGTDPSSSTAGKKPLPPPARALLIAFIGPFYLKMGGENRHGWGCRPDPTQAIYYLTLAAQNSAQVESVALRSGLKRGGAAKGELVLAIYELANCFRHGWGLSKDPLAAKHYYETAANLGDVDAMNEVAWCYETGFGAVKDKVGCFGFFMF